MRRLVLPVLLIVTAAVAVAQAVRLDRADRAGAQPPAAPAAASSATAVLSARRAPQWLLQPTSDANVVAVMDQVAAFAPADTCLAVTDQGRVIYRRRADVALTPASTEKLVTALTALGTIGPATKLRTSVLATAAPVGGVVTGDVFLVGGGDPVLATADYQARYEEPRTYSDLGALADALAKAGVKRITGTIVGDDRRYDALRYVPSWPERFSTVQHQTGPLSALAVNDGFVSWKPYKDAGDGLSVPAPDPAKQGAEVFTQQLAQRGVVVGGPARSGAAPAAGTVELAGLDSPTIEGLVAEMLSASDNSTAELLFKEAGRVATGTGSTASGVAAAKKALQAAGVPTAGVVTVDGSGLDPTNKVTCDLLTALLDKAGPTSATAKGLPVAGRTGTLRLRMKNTPAEGRLMAKTGTLSTASSLAGFAPRNDGRTITFAFVANKAVLATETVQALQDRMGAELVAATGVPTLEQLAPPTPG